MAEVFERKLHLKRGYPSLHEFCVKELKYTDGQTFRRIKAMQLLKSFPECEQKIEQGSLSLTNAASAQNYFIQNKITSVSEKAEILEKIENKSSRESERVFKELGGQPSKRKIEIDEETFQLLKELQAFRSHKEQKMGEMIKAVITKELAAEKARRFGKYKSAGALKTPVRSNLIRSEAPQSGSAQSELTYAEPVEADRALTDKKASRSGIKPAALAPKLSPLTKTGRYIPVQVRQLIFRRDQCCTFVDPETKRRCESQWQLEIDHIQPYAQGGSNAHNNLRLFCDAHNRARQSG